MNRFESKSSGLDSGCSDVSSEDMEKSSADKSSDKSSVISIIGSGDFGRALALRMVQSGYSVCIGSRNPERNQ